MSLPRAGTLSRLRAENQRSGFCVLVRTYGHPHARALVAALFGEQVDRYGYADPTEAESDTYARPRGLFLVGYLEGAPVACGGFRTHHRCPDTVEIKKMYTLPAVRGRGLGRVILDKLEREAAAGGARRAILETGVRNTAALRVYAGANYVPAGPYVRGRDPAINRAFTKML